MSMVEIETKNLINEVFNSALVTGGVIVVSMVSKKVFGDSLGVTQTLSGFSKLAAAIGGSTVLIRTLQNKGLLPKVIDK